MPKQYDIHDELYEWMIRYQEKNDEPPTLDEVADAIGSMNFRSSARHTLHSLIMRGLVEIIKPEGYARRYKAILPEKEPVMT